MQKNSCFVIIYLVFASQIVKLILYLLDSYVKWDHYVLS